MRLSGLFIYPVKSARGIALSEARLSDRGLVHDRRFMVVDEHGRFVTQREQPALARLTTAIHGDALALSFEGSTLTVPLAPSEGAERRVRVFVDELTALDLGRPAQEFLTQAFGRPLALVYMPSATRRQVDPTRASEQDVVSFADGFPYLLTSESSLAALNLALAEPVPMARFRPNFVIEGAPAYAEDAFRELTIGGLCFVALKLCRRCVIVNTDQTSGARGPGPLEGLIRTHAVGKNPIFGQNLVARELGTLRVGDLVST
jgi:uncharacterized protein YcbX